MLTTALTADHENDAIFTFSSSSLNVVLSSSKFVFPSGHAERSLSEKLNNSLDKVHICVNNELMKTIRFYRTMSGNCPVEDHLDSLTDAQVTKITWVLKLIREIDRVPSKYFKKLINTDDIWEVRIDVAKNTFRLLGFFYGNELIILTNSFQKKSQKTPKKEIILAEKRKKEYLSRGQANG